MYWLEVYALIAAVVFALAGLLILMFGVVCSDIAALVPTPIDWQFRCST